uniref:Uncharacterized protein n=1 Tax=Ananas comosus var. bracteatus TaxID=296719 RepID=A0A6V7Q8N5_ANACO|nr:unnamed protein product [Ananas comosus var. bracteatus]
MGFVDPMSPLLATCGGDTVKLFDVTVDSGDPCVLSYSPSPGSQVNSVKWNHTNLVVASAGDDKKISLWHKKGQNIGVVPLAGSDLGDDIEESIVAVSFSNKGSRYLCSGGSGHIVRIWDLQRKRCIKWLSGHTDTITGVMYNCKDEHLASISVKGDLILHNLASGARAAELKDPNGQVLRVLDYSRLSRHVLVTAGDDGSIHLWDTTARAPKVSWLKQHSAPTTGVCFSPSSDKIIASVGLDKKLYMFDSGTRRSTHCIPYEAPFSSLVYNDDGNILTAGTNSGRVVFYDVRGKPQPLTVLRAYSSSEAVASLCWQRSKPVIVNENNCTAEVALLGGTSEESVLMPDPLPSLSSSSFSSATTVSSFRSSLTASTSGASVSNTLNSSAVEETPHRSRLLTGGNLSRLQAPRGSYNLKDDMDVFSPLVDVQPITPSLGNWWDEHDEAKKDIALADKKSTLFSTSTRKFAFNDGNIDGHPISDWRSSSNSKQDDTQSLSTNPVLSIKNESSLSPTPDKLIHLRQQTSLSRFVPSTSIVSGSTFAGLQDSSSSTSNSVKSSLSNPSIGSMNLQNKPLSNNTNSSAFLDSLSAYNLTAVSTTSETKSRPSTANTEIPGSAASTLPWKYSTYAERISTSSAFSEGMASAIVAAQPSRTLSPPTDQQHATSSFSLQLVQRTLEETLGSVQKSIHEDVRNLHIELLRQFHMQEMEMSSLLAAVLEKQDALMKEVQMLRKENQQLRLLL